MPQNIQSSKDTTIQSLIQMIAASRSTGILTIDVSLTMADIQKYKIISLIQENLLHTLQITQPLAVDATISILESIIPNKHLTSLTLSFEANNFAVIQRIALLLQSTQTLRLLKLNDFLGWDGAGTVLRAVETNKITIVQIDPSERSDVMDNFGFTFASSSGDSRTNYNAAFNLLPIVCLDRYLGTHNAPLEQQRQGATNLQEALQKVSGVDATIRQPLPSEIQALIKGYVDYFGLNPTPTVTFHPQNTPSIAAPFEEETKGGHEAMIVRFSTGSSSSLLNPSVSYLPNAITVENIPQAREDVEETKNAYEVKEAEETTVQDYPVALAAISEILVPFDDDEEEEFQVRFVIAESLREFNDAMTVAPPPDLSSSSPAYYAALSSATHVTSTTTTSTVAIVETPEERRREMEAALKKRGL
jgi:hypothetical protein